MFTVDFSCFPVHFLSSKWSGASVHMVFICLCSFLYPEIDRAYGEVSDRVPVNKRRCSSCTQGKRLTFFYLFSIKLTILLDLTLKLCILVLSCMNLV